MSDTTLLAGPSLRRLRKREGMTQAAMAASLGISPSYLNLIERNQRPLSARVLVQVIERFDFDPRTLREDEAIGGVDGLARRMADKRFADLGIDREEVQEFLAAAPQAAGSGPIVISVGDGGQNTVAPAGGVNVDTGRDPSVPLVGVGEVSPPGSETTQSAAAQPLGSASLA